ncbi:hypothetical protein D3C86_2083550 [compost metagenome]
MLVILALVVGEHYAGGIGLLVAVPAAAIVRALLTFVYRLLVAAPVPAGVPERLEAHAPHPVPTPDL